MSRRYRTVNVFTRENCGGNPLAVVLEANGLSDQEMLKIAREFNYSETAFVCRPIDLSNTAKLRIFTPAVEVPFAGHPTIGTAYTLAQLDAYHSGLKEVRLEVRAGLVPVRLIYENDHVVGGELKAPEALKLGRTFDPATIAGCVNLSENDISTVHHQPLIASVGLPFVVVEIASRAALRRAFINLAAFSETIPRDEADAMYLYSWDTFEEDGNVDWTARMFAPCDGLLEDPATGSATGATAALLASIETSESEVRRYSVAQGVDMGRPSLLEAVVQFAEGNTNTVRVGGYCVDVRHGWLDC